MAEILTYIQDIPIQRNFIEDLPFNIKLKERSRKLRKAGNFPEVVFWKQVRAKTFWKIDFDRQRIIGNYIVDFFCKDLQLAIEVDGVTHLDEKVMAKDFLRQEDIESYGVSFLRFDALLVVNKVEAAVREIREWIEVYEKKKVST